MQQVKHKIQIALLHWIAIKENEDREFEYATGNVGKSKS
jgi:hypothetical protein